jgi:hypothetical protein
MKTVLFLLGMFQAMAAFSQHSLIVSSKRNVVYVGIHNYIDFMVENKSCAEFVLKSSDEIMEPSDVPCTYIVKPTKPGKFKVSLNNKRTRKVVNEVTLTAINLPPPEVMITGKKSGKISRSFMKQQLGLLAVLEGFDMETRYEIEKYIIIVIRSGKAIFSLENKGATFVPKVKEALQKIETGDRIIFADINYKGPDGNIGVTKPAEFLITE